MTHKPVLLKEVLDFLDPKKGDFFIDGTYGSGGHFKAIKEKVGKDGKMIALDWDKENLKKLKKGKDIFKEGNYADLENILKEAHLGKADGLILDLGFSSEQLEGGRGFSFNSLDSEEPLLMTYSDKEKSVDEILKEISEKKLAEIIKDFSGEKYAGKIAKAIKERRWIKSGNQLAKIIREAVPENYENRRIDPATRTFQALRIYANHELENLENILKDLPKIIKKGGRVVIISFHSLEDKLVKNYFKKFEKEKLAEVLTKKPIKAKAREVADNPRSRSALLRSIKIIK